MTDSFELIRTSKHYKFYSQKYQKRSFHKLAVNLELFTAKSHHAISIFTTAFANWLVHPLLTAVYALPRIKHNKITFIKDNCFLINAFRQKCDVFIS